MPKNYIKDMQPPMNEKKFRRIERNFNHYGSFSVPRNQNKDVTGNEDHEVTVLGYFHAYPKALLVVLKMIWDLVEFQYGEFFVNITCTLIS